jgi:pimeloyl-ACP methyl ester carboxylesterase
MESMMNQESNYLQVDHHQLHLRHIFDENSKQPVLMIHGAIENGKIFYSEKGKGFGCYLAQQGFDVHVVDLRGRGSSKPSIKELPDHGQYHSIVHDIPALINHIYDSGGQKPIHLVCHSWGGVLVSSSLVRFPELRNKVRSLLCFGTKRQVTVWNAERLFKVSLVWKRLAPLITKKVGYLDAKKYKIGSDAETHDTLTQGAGWVKLSEWKDPIDGFDYAAAAERFEWPPTWHLTGIKDMALGHAKDVQLFIKECHNHNAIFTNLSKKEGAALDYDHINILTAPEALTDHFPKLAEWLQNNT